MYNVDEHTMSSLNGFQVNEHILRLVPNVEVESIHLIYFIINLSVNMTWISSHLLSPFYFGLVQFVVAAFSHHTQMLEVLG